MAVGRRCFSGCAANSRWRCRSGLIGLGIARLGAVRGRPAGSSARRKRRARPRACVRRSSRWSSTTTAARCAARVLAGRHQGAALEKLDLTTLVGLLPEFDEDSRALLAAYLDRREPGWREHAQDGAAAGQRTAGRAAGKMTEEEAYQILGVAAGGGPTESAGRTAR